MSIIQIDKSEINISKGISTTISCTLVPSASLNNKLDFVVANPNIAEITSQTDTTVTIEGKGQGQTTIKVTSEEDPTATNTITCNVTDPYYSDMFSNRSQSKIYIDNNDLKMFKGDTKEVNYQLYPCSLINHNLTITSTNEDVVKISKQVGTQLTLEAIEYGNAKIVLKSEEDANLIAYISVSVLSNLEAPAIYEKIFVGKKVNITLADSTIKTDTVLVDFSWTSDKDIDLTVNDNKFEFEVPSYDTEYYIRIAYKKGIYTSQWLTEKIITNEKTPEEIEKELAEKIQREDISLSVAVGSFDSSDITKFKVFFEGTNLEAIEYTLSFETEDDNHTVSYDSSKSSNYVEVQCPNDYTIYTIKARGTNSKGKTTSWIKKELNDVRFASANPSRDIYNIDYSFFTVFERTDVSPELISAKLYDDVEGSEERAAGIGEVFISDPMDKNLLIPCNCNVGIHMEVDAIPELNRCAWGSIRDGKGDKHYVKVGVEFFNNCYHLKSLCYENCLGRDLGGFILFEDSIRMVASVHRFDIVKRDNFAVAGVLVEGIVYPVAGFKLLQDTAIYDKDGNMIKVWKKGCWIWMTSKYTSLTNDDKNMITGGEKSSTDSQRMAIHSYSKDTSISEILENWAKDDNGNKNGIYFMDTYFNLNMSLYAIDTRRLPDRRTVGKGDIVNGYFDFDNYGTPTLLWSGSKYSIRSSVDNTDNIKDGNVIAHIHQCYLMTTSTGEDISKSSAGSACMWTTNNCSTNDYSATGDIGKKFADRHKVEEFYFAKGFFDVQNLTDGYFVGQKYVALCTTEWRHQQNGQHIGYGGEQFVLDSNTQEEKIDIKELTDDKNQNTDNAIIDSENLVGISNSVLSSFFPFMQYITKRIRKKCVEATGKPLDLLQVICSAYNSNFAIYNDPVNGVELNGTKIYKPLYAVKVLNDTSLYVQTSMTCKDLEAAKNSSDEEVKLKAGSWVWFSEEYPPKISDSNRNCLSIVGFSLGTDINGDPEGQVLIAPCYVDAGLSNVSTETGEISFLDKIKGILTFEGNRKKENDISFPYSALHYNIATMANPDGDEPHLVYEDDYYGRIIRNTLCYNNTNADIHVTMEDGEADLIKTGRLFTFIGEYSNENIKLSRIYYYSDAAKAYKYGSIETPASSLFDRYIMNTATRTVRVEGDDYMKSYGIIPLPTATKIYTKYGEQYAVTEVREGVLDAVLFDNQIQYKQKTAAFDIMNLPTYIKNGSLGDRNDIVHGLQDVNQSLMESAAPNWLGIDYYVYKSYERVPVNQRIDGYVRLDFSADYTNLIK